MNDTPPPPPPPPPLQPARSETTRVILVVVLLLVALPVLGFTACGLIVGIGDLTSGSSGFATVGFACAGVGGLVLWGLFVALRRLRKPRP